jgi:hypothetical protein
VTATLALSMSFTDSHIYGEESKAKQQIVCFLILLSPPVMRMVLPCRDGVLFLRSYVAELVPVMLPRNSMAGKYFKMLT